MKEIADYLSADNFFNNMYFYETLHKTKVIKFRGENDTAYCILNI